MKKLLLFSTILLTISSIGQISNTESSLLTSDPSQQKVSTDSFSFCSIKFKVPRDCNKKSEANCCTAETSARGGNLGCYNGITLMWTYFQNEKSLRDYFEYRTSHSQKEQIKRFHKKPITCFLLGKQIEGFRIKFENFKGVKWQSIIIEDKINDKYVSIELLIPSHRKLKEQNISTGIKQILKLKK
ncbi:MAG: hypothetical protein JNN00_14700 [Chitinophagaceae bacterium]|nr:hypothetical protein [Chitinophagaceae bacterium]